MNEWDQSYFGAFLDSLASSCHPKCNEPKCKQRHSTTHLAPLLPSLRRLVRKAGNIDTDNCMQEQIESKKNRKPTKEEKKAQWGAATLNTLPRTPLVRTIRLTNGSANQPCDQQLVANVEQCCDQWRSWSCLTAIRAHCGNMALFGTTV